MHKSPTGQPYLVMRPGSKVLLMKGKPKHSSGSGLLLSPGLGTSLPPASNFSIKSNDSRHSLHTMHPSDVKGLNARLSRLSLKGGDLKRKKYISL